jgi:hypothetical protein
MVQVVWLTSGEQTQLRARFPVSDFTPSCERDVKEAQSTTMEQLIEGCRRQRQALIQTVATLRAAKENASAQNVTSAQINAALDARIFNCECSIARYELVITEAEAKAPGGSS